VVLQAVEDAVVHLVIVHETAKPFALGVRDEPLGGESPEDRCPVELRNVVVEQVFLQPLSKVGIGLLGGALAPENIVDLRKTSLGVLTPDTLELGLDVTQEVIDALDGRNRNDSVVGFVGGFESEVQEKIFDLLGKVLRGFGNGFGIVFFLLAWVFIGSEGYFLKYRIALVSSDVEAIENLLVNCVRAGLEIRPYSFKMCCRYNTEGVKRCI
jgi:hypothetical protein